VHSFLYWECYTDTDSWVNQLGSIRESATGWINGGDNEKTN